MRATQRAGGGASGAPDGKGWLAAPSPRAAALVRGARAGRLPGAPGPSDRPLERSFLEVGPFPSDEPSPFASQTLASRERTFCQRLFIHSTNPNPPPPLLTALGNTNADQLGPSSCTTI